MPSTIVKMVHSLHSKFDYVVLTIAQARDVEERLIDELTGPLEVYRESKQQRLLHKM